MMKYPIRHIYDYEWMNIRRSSLPSKRRILAAIRRLVLRGTCFIKVHKVAWQTDFPRADALMETIAFDLYNFKELDELVGYIFQSSIDGYAIRYVSPDALTGIYLEKTLDNSTNIDDEMIDALVAAVENDPIAKPMSR